MTKAKERRRLLKLHQETGDEDYRRAAECLRLPLLEQIREHVREKNLHPGTRGETAGKAAPPRLYRMARMIADGATVHAAATREVEHHGAGAHAGIESAVRYLSGRYREHRVEIEAEAAALNNMERQFAAHLRASEQLAARLMQPLEPLRAALTLPAPAVGELPPLVVGEIPRRK